MPEIIIEQSTFERLQRHAKPLVDTTDSVLNRALDALESQENDAGSEQNDVAIERQINPRTLPNLTHTKILDASLAGQHVVRPNWNLLLDKMLIRAMKQLGSLDELRQLCPANMVQGIKEENGYRHLAEIDISVQGMSANDACAALVAIAQSLRFDLKITFMWRPKEGAMYPGEKARMEFSGKPTVS